MGVADIDLRDPATLLDVPDDAVAHQPVLDLGWMAGSRRRSDVPRPESTDTADRLVPDALGDSFRALAHD